MSENDTNPSKKAQSQASKHGVHLGTPPNYGPTLNNKDLQVTSDGEVISDSSRSGSRMYRYIRQSCARKLLPKNRVSWCIRRRSSTTDGIHVLKSIEHGTAHFGNLITCGQVWNCPVCAAKVSERRRFELIKVVDAHKSAGGSVLLTTFTYSHSREDNLSELLEKQKKAFQYLKSHRRFKAIKSRISQVGSVRALEITHGQANGWHPHIHELWFLDSHIDDYESIKLELFVLWHQACEKYGLGLPSLDHGVDVRGGDYAASYASKWGIENEITKGHIKNGRKGSYSPFQLLDNYLDGDKQSAKLFIEYASAFKGKKQLSWSRGMKDRYDISDITDEALAVVQEDDAQLLGTISYEYWKILINSKQGRFQDNRFIILTLAENGGWPAVESFIEGICSG